MKLLNFFDKGDVEMENDERGGGASRFTGERGKLLVVLILSLLIISSTIAVFILWGGEEGDKYDKMMGDEPSPNPYRLTISEIYLGEGEEYFEIYVGEGDGNGTIKLKVTTYDENPFTLPAVTPSRGFSYIVVYSGEGESDTDLSDGVARIFLNIDGDFLEESDELGLYDEKDRLIDFVRWGGGGGDRARGGWDYLTTLPSPPPGKSISLQGEDEGPNSYWTISPPTPGESNILDLPLNADGTWRLYLVNGRTERVYPGEGGKFTYRAINVNVSAGMAPGHPVNQTLIRQVQEYINFTYNLLKENGYGDALASGTDSEGRPYVKVTITANGTYSGACSSNGEIEVDIGSNKVASKQTVEHEMTHNFQFAKRPDGSSHINPWENNFVDEGAAEFWGRYSAMKNFNLTWVEVEKELKKAGSLNIYDYYHDSWYDIFEDWPDAYNKTYVSGGHYYAGSFLFMKFLVDKYGIGIMSKIYNTVRNNGSSSDVVGIKAIEAATGEKFEDLLREFNLYRLEKRFPQYKEDRNFTGSKPDKVQDFPGHPISSEEGVESWGSRINVYNLNGSGCIVSFRPKTDRSRWQVTIIKVRGDGSREYENHTLEKGESDGWYIPGGYKKIIVIKTRLNGSNYIWEDFNITIYPPPVITPLHPRRNDWIMWDPPPFNWSATNLSDIFGVRIQVSNDSGFSDLIYNLTVHGEGINLSLPNGTYWWRIRWEGLGLQGPWRGGWNFTVWHGPFRTDAVLWDPPYYPWADGGGWVIGRDTTVMFKPTQPPENFPPLPTWVEVRLSSDPSRVLNISGEELYKPFPLGSSLAAGVGWMEWRGVLGPYYEPFHRMDLFLDTTPPELHHVSPQEGGRYSNNGTWIVQWMDDCPHYSPTNFTAEIFYSVNGGDPTHYEMPYEIAPDEVRVPLNFSTLPEGSVAFMMRLTNPLGMTTPTLRVTFYVDHTPPEFTLTTLPEEHFFNDSVTIRVESAEEVRYLSFRLENFDGVIVYGGERDTPPPTYEWEMDLRPLPEGEYTLYVTLMDYAGNTATQNLSFIVDHTPPDFIITSPGDGDKFELGTPVVVVVQVLFEPPEMIKSCILYFNTTGEDPIEVGEMLMIEPGVWQLSWIPEGVGNYTLTIKVSDRAGNVATRHVGISVIG